VAISTSREYDPYGKSARLRFWDVATGEQVGQWDSGVASAAGQIYKLVGLSEGRLVAIDFDPPYPDTPKVLPGPPGISNLIVSTPRKDPRHTVLLDTSDRREVGRYQGGSPRLSHDGRWLATIDHLGVVRVWDISNAGK